MAVAAARAVAAVGAESRATQRAEELQRLLYFSNIGFAQSALENNDMAGAYRLLDGCDVALREWEWSYLQRLRDLSNETLYLHLDRPRYASFTRDRRRIALATHKLGAEGLFSCVLVVCATSEPDRADRRSSASCHCIDMVELQ